MKSMYTVENAGTVETPRYIVMNDTGKYFNEEDETWGEKSESTLYSTVDPPLRVIQDLLLESFGKMPNRVFVAPLIVNLYTDEDVTKKQVEEWLQQVVRVSTDANHRMSLGPVSNSLGILMLDCKQLRESDVK